MSPGRDSDSLAIRLGDGEKEAFNAFAERFGDYKKGELVRLALAHFVRAHGMDWPEMGRLDNEPYPMNVPKPKPPKPAPPAPKTKRGDRA